MQRALLVVGTVIVSLLIGWQAPRLLHMAKVAPQSQQCSDDNCKIVVMVESWCLTCDVSVDYEVMVANGHNITWEIDAGSAPRYEFADNGGIAFPKGFSCQKEDGKKFKCKNDNPKPSQLEVYKYTVNVTDTRYHKNLEPLDPFVVNN